MSSTERNRSIKHAVLTSILSKAGTALLQLMAIPVAIHTLGWQEFGLYASIAGLLLSVQLFEVGLGPALAHGLSSATANDDRLRQRQLASTSFFMMAGLMTLAAVVMGAVIVNVPVELLFGKEFGPFAEVMRPALWTGLGLLLLTMMLSHTDRLREGFLQVSANNSWGAAGNFLAAGAIAIGVKFVPTVSFLLFAVFGSQVLAKLANTVQLWRSRPWIIPRPSGFDGKLARWMMGDSIAYAVFASVVNFVEFNVVQNLYGRIAGPEGVTGYTVLITITVALLGFVLMFTTPVWPAVVNAKARGDYAWIRSAARRLWLYVIVFALCAGVGLVLFGPWLLPVWVGKKAESLHVPVLAGYAVYFLAYAWRHANHMLLVGAGRVRLLAVIQVVESAVVLGVAWFAMNDGGLAELMLAMGVAIFAITGWILPWILHVQVKAGLHDQQRSLEDAESETVAVL